LSMTPGLPEILKRATGMAELDCRYTWKSSPPRPSVEPHWGTVPKLGCLAERNAEILRPDQIGTQVRFQDSDGVHRTPAIGDDSGGGGSGRTEGTSGSGRTETASGVRMTAWIPAGACPDCVGAGMTARGLGRR
jgi:hypothetical protein